MNEPATRLAISIPQASESLGISRYLLTRMIREGTIPATRAGRRIILPVQPLKDWLLKRTP